MNEKRKAILEQAMILFATKGFHSTSIQEIADQAGISKGGVYSYFSSKNELLVEIYRFYYQNIRSEIDNYQHEEQLHPKERLQFQIKVYMEELLSHKEFILMHINENVSHSKELEEFLLTVKKDTFNWYETSLKNIYGDPINPYIMDLSIILRGMIESYLVTLFSTKASVSIDELTAFIISRLDDLAEGLVKKNETPPFDSDMDFLTCHSLFEEGLWRKKLHDDLLQIENLILNAELDKGTRKDCIDTIALLKEEVRQDKPKKVVFQGLLNNFNVVPETQTISENILLILTKIND